MIYWREYNFTDLPADTVFCFDSESTSFWIRPDGSITGYDASLSNEHYNAMSPGGICYIWMLSINDIVLYSRKLSELPELLSLIKEYSPLDNPVIYVHNLAFDFQFLRNVISFKSEDIFARTRRKPMYARTPEGVEFRCSYMLTRLSLAAWSKTLDIKKQTGLLDYDKLRTPLTPMTEAELKYCEYDVLVMYRGILKYIQKYGKIADIPLTQTGEVRKVIKKMYSKNNGYHFKVTDLQPKTFNEYKRLKAVFAGGETHANRLYVSCEGEFKNPVTKKITKINQDKILKNVGSFDKTSDYPYQMCCEMFPMSRFVKTSNDLRFLKPETYAYIIEVHMINVCCITNTTYISRSHCVSIKGGVYDNGRLISADAVALCMTELDYATICDMYTFTIDEVIGVWRSRKGYMPKEYIEYILDLYEYKTTLKGDPDKSDLYAQSKQFINSLYGMEVTDIIMPDVKYTNNQWDDYKPLTADEIQQRLDDIQSKWYKNNLAYQWGVWVTAYARRELMQAVLFCDAVEVYHDTDSVKLLHWRDYKYYFDFQNTVMDEKLKKMCEHYDIDFERTRPLKPNGKSAPLGHWDFEGIYTKFKTLGAKKYAYWYMFESDGVTIKPENYGMHVTVSGVPKMEGSVLLKDLRDFKEGFVFDREKCGKKLITYIDDLNPLVTFPDGYTVDQVFACNLRNIEYTISQTAEYAETINHINEAKGFLK